MIKLVSILSIVCLLFFWSCSNEPGDSPFVDSEAESTILIYAVATNSLSSNLVSDKNEMIQAASEIDLNKNNILVFETKYNPQDKSQKKVNLLRLSKMGDQYDWETLREFSDDFDPLDAERISEIIKYVSDNFKAKNNGLVLWSHSTASQPYFPNTNTRSGDILSYSFGEDKLAIEINNKYINVDQLADAIPDGLFDFIWFDSCYMSNIETIYEFRKKCNIYVGYPTEVLEDGLPYHLVLPYMTGTSPDLLTAAETFFKYYAENSSSILRRATIAMLDMSKIELLADLCRQVYSAGTGVNTSSLIKYSRSSTGPFYDLGDYTISMSVNTGIELTSHEWNSVLDQFVLYKNATLNDFDFRPVFIQERYSGISTHVYSFDNDSESERYYKSLDWYNRVF